MINNAQYLTQSKIEIKREVHNLSIEDALAEIRSGVATQAGALFSSGYEYPGRYSRWDIGFSNPPIELISWGRKFSLKARNEKGETILNFLSPIIKEHEHIQNYEESHNSIDATLIEMDEFFPEEERSRQPSLFTVLRSFNHALTHELDSHLGFFGAFGYDLVFQFDPIKYKHERTNVPDARLFLPDEIIIVDRRFEEAYRLEYNFSFNGESTVGLSRQSKPCTTKHKATKKAQPGLAKGEYAQKVRTVQEGCKRGDYFEVVLSHILSTTFEGDALEVLDIIQERNPSPYEFLIQLENEQLVGASPEMFVRVEGDMVETCPISGTVARGESPLEDADQIRSLLSSDKEEAELTMCTDVDRNDKSRVCIPESVKVLGRRLIEVYSKVIHTVDHVEGQLKEGMDGLDAFLSHMWAVTLSGSPKKAAMQAIEDLEDSPREWYGGAVGFLCFNGNINTGITIRTVRIKEGIAEVRVGATLLAASDPESEERETELKAEAFIKAVKEGNKTAPVDTYLPKSGHGKKVLFIDHEDSFVHTLGGYVKQTGAEVLTLRSGFPLSMIDEFKPDLVFLSPGPFNPEHFGLPKLIKELMERKLPIFGVCLGLQGIVESLGGTLGVLDIPQHGVHAFIEHQDKSVFSGLPQPMKASRYHSLYAIEDNLPKDLEITAKSQDDIIMGIHHKTYPMAAVQFHPESIHAIGQNAGLKLIDNVLKILT